MQFKIVMQKSLFAFVGLPYKYWTGFFIQQTNITIEIKKKEKNALS